MTDTILQKFTAIKAFVFGMDGVLTDGSLFCNNDGEMIRTMNIKDGYGMAQAVAMGYHMAIISGSSSPGAKIRLERLGIKDIFMGIPDKHWQLLYWAQSNDIAPENVLYMGDDILDVKAMKACGIKACPSDAVQDVIEIADYVSAFPGGRGCVRDVIEKVMKLHNKWLFE